MVTTEAHGSIPATKPEGHSAGNEDCTSPLSWDEAAREMDEGDLLDMGVRINEGGGKQIQVQNSEGSDVISLVQAEIDSFRSASIEMQWRVKLAKGFLEGKDGAVVLEWWRQVGERSYPLLAAVAKSILTIPVTSAAVERSISGNTPLMTWEKIAGETTFTDMALYLNATRDERVNYDLVGVQTMAKIKSFMPHALRTFLADNGIKEYANDESVPNNERQFIDGEDSLIHCGMWEEYAQALDIPI